MSEQIIVLRLDELDRRSRSEVRTAYSDYYKNLRILSDFLGRFFDSCEFFLIIIFRKAEPSEEVISFTRSVVKLVMCGFNLRSDVGICVFFEERSYIFCV